MNIGIENKGLKEQQIGELGKKSGCTTTAFVCTVSVTHLSPCDQPKETGEEVKKKKIGLIV